MLYLGFFQLDIQRPAGNVDVDDIAVSNGTDRTTVKSLHLHVPDTGAGGGTRKPAIGDQRYPLVTRTLNRIGRGQHLGHSRCPRRALERQHHHIALGDVLGLDGVQQVLLGGKNLSRAGVNPHFGFDRRLLDDRAVGDVAFENGNAAFGMVGIGDTSNDVRISNFTPCRHFGRAVAAYSRAVFDQVFQPV